MIGHVDFFYRKDNLGPVLVVARGGKKKSDIDVGKGTVTTACRRESIFTVITKEGNERTVVVEEDKKHTGLAREAEHDKLSSFCIRGRIEQSWGGFLQNAISLQKMTALVRIPIGRTFDRNCTHSGIQSGPPPLPTPPKFSFHYYGRLPQWPAKPVPVFDRIFTHAGWDAATALSY